MTLKTTMFIVQHIVVVALTLACASGRPEGNDIEDVTKPPKTVALSNKNESILVNERYPSAVLFGGTCGGTIISSTWILTAAHCTISSSHYVRAGTSTIAYGKGVTGEVKRQVIHPLFSVGPYWVNANKFKIKQVAAHYDFLLAELKDPLLLDGKTIAAAKLDEELTHRAGQNVGFAGFGTDHFGGYMSFTMHEMLMDIQSDETCSKVMEQFVPNNMICTRGRQPKLDSPCNGDSGSGLIDESGRLLGIMSWSENDSLDCSKGRLSAFSRVASVREWIRNVTNV